ncbi:hypothetical protein D3C74_447000 [compost metagenome]
MQLFPGKVDEGGFIAFFVQPVIGFPRLRYILADRRSIDSPVVIHNPVGDFLFYTNLKPAADRRRGIIELARPGQVACSPNSGCFLNNNDLGPFVRRRYGC